ncbi:MAG: CRISPR-associated endonuclease Cas2 [Patescibacteria group bacterium]
MAIKSETKEKIILLLASGVILGFSRSPRNYFKVLKSVAKEWKEINRNKLVRIVREFYNDRIVDYKENKDGSVKIVLTKEGQNKALRFKLDEMEIKKPAKWDGEWRIVIFDIPEKFKKAREALRMKLKELGFLELQKSVFVLPYECEDEINFIMEVFLIRSFVRFVRAKSFTNEEQLKIKFGLY